MERVTGRAKYAADWRRPGMIYAKPILSTVPHAVVVRFDAEDALRIDGVEAIISCFDDATVWFAGERERQRRVFTDRVRFVGDCVGAVAARSRRAAAEAAASVRIEYSELPSACTVAESASGRAIWDGGNRIGPIGYGFGDARAAFNAADLVMESEYETSRVHNAPLEPATSLAWWEGDRLTVVAGTQGIFGCREGISKDLGVRLEDVRVVTLYKGGGFGNKNSSMNYDLMAALLSRKTGRPVMMEYSRLEDFVGVHGRWSSSQRLRAAVSSASGRLLAVEVSASCDIGAYTRHVKTGRFVDGAESYYSCDAWSAEVVGNYTNTPATAHMRAPTGPQACFAAESMADEVAHRIGIDPLEFRLRNAASKHHGTDDFTSNGLRQCLLLGARAIGWKEKWRPPPQPGELSAAGEKLAGVGVAIAAWHARLGRGEAVVSLRPDGTADVYAGVVDIGTGAKSVMALEASNALGVRVEDVRVVWGDTDSCPYSVGESGSRTTTFTGAAVREAALLVRGAALQLASEKLKVQTGGLELAGGAVAGARSGAKVRLDELLEWAGLPELTRRAVTEPRLPERVERYCFAAHFAGVTVDPETGEVVVSRYVAAHESGKIVNRITAESQVQGGVVMGLGMALSERLLIDPNQGSIQNPSLLSYRLANAASVPRIEPIFVEVDDPYGPKSLGEIPVVPVPAAIGNAIFNASGVRLRSLPFLPEAYIREESAQKGVPSRG